MPKSLVTLRRESLFNTGYIKAEFLFRVLTLNSLDYILNKKKNGDGKRFPSKLRR